MDPTERGVILGTETGWDTPRLRSGVLNLGWAEERGGRASSGSEGERDDLVEDIGE